MVAAVRHTPQKDLEHVLWKIEKGDDTVYWVGKKKWPEQKALHRLMNDRSRKYPSLREMPELSNWVSAYYYAVENGAHEDKRKKTFDALCKEVLPTDYYTGSDEEPTPIIKALEILLEGFQYYTDEQGRRPGLMANDRNYLVEHTLHMVKLLFHGKETDEMPLEDAIATILHDYWEDVPEQHQISEDEASNLIGKGLGEKQKKLVKRGIRASRRLTLRKGDDYFRGIETIFKYDDETTHEKKAKHELEKTLEISCAARVKLIDKISGMQDIGSFDYHKCLRLFGKTYKVANETRKWYFGLPKSVQKMDFAKEVLELTSQTTLVWYDSIRWLMKKVKRDLPLLVDDYESNPASRKWVRHAVASVKRLANQYFGIGGLTWIDTDKKRQEGEKMAKRFRKMRGTIRYTKLLGMHLKKTDAPEEEANKTYIPQSLMLEGETQEGARIRLLEEREGRKHQYMPCSVKDYLLISNRRVAMLTEKEKKIRENFPTKEKALRGYLNLLHPLYALIGKARKLSLDQKHYDAEGF